MSAAATQSVHYGKPLQAACSLARREVVRFLRQRNRVIGALAQPVVFWLLFGTGLQRSFRLSPAGSDGPSFLAYYFPGTIVLMLLFTAIFSTISIIEDRREGFLQSVLVAPIPRWSMVLGKVLGGTILAVGQAAVLLLLALTLDVQAGWFDWLAILLLLCLTALSLTSLGLIIAWRMESTQGFHAIMNLMLMPMWLLSGAFFPVPPWAGAAWSQRLLHIAMRLNPLTYCVAGLRQLMMGDPPPAAYWSPSLAMCWIGTLLFAGATFAIAWSIAGRNVRGDLL